VDLDLDLMSLVSRLRPGGRHRTLDELINFCCRLFPIIVRYAGAGDGRLVAPVLRYVFQELEGTGLYGIYSAIAFYGRRAAGVDARPWPLDLPEANQAGVSSRWNFLFIENATNLCDDIACLFFSHNDACAHKIEGLVRARVHGKWKLEDRLDELLGIVEERIALSDRPSCRSVVAILRLVTLLARGKQTQHINELYSAFLRHLGNLPPIVCELFLRKWDYDCFALLQEEKGESRRSLWASPKEGAPERKFRATIPARVAEAQAPRTDPADIMVVEEEPQA
jgi:hypothetical protein